MAKTTKVVNKRTTSSKSNNINNSKGFFGKSFDLKNRKVQFFVVILIVAILGGGYFTFKSFAATTQSWVYDINKGNLTMNVSPLNECSYSKYNEPTKNGKTVWSMACPNISTTSTTAISADTALLPLIGRNYSGNYRACAFIKGGGKGIQVYVRGGSQGRSAFPMVSTNGYGYYCSPKIFIKSPATVSGGVQLSSGAQAGGWITVSSVVIERLSL